MMYVHTVLTALLTISSVGVVKTSRLNAIDMALCNANCVLPPQCKSGPPCSASVKNTIMNTVLADACQNSQLQMQRQINDWRVFGVLCAIVVGCAFLLWFWQDLMNWPAVPAHCSIRSLRHDWFRHSTYRRHTFYHLSTATSQNGLETYKGPFCMICMDGFGEKDAIRLSCSHIFHEECLLLWLNQKDTCPLCRRSVGSCAFPKTKSRYSSGEIESQNDSA